MGYAGRIEFPAYLAWLRTLPCDTCGKPAPSEASHVNSVKGMGTKSPDPFSIPECTSCNRNYDRRAPQVDDRLTRAAWYLLRAIYEGHLIWKRQPTTEPREKS